MKYFKIALVSLVAIVGMTSCKSQYEALLSSNDVDTKYKAAFKYFERGKYQRAANLFESMSVLTNGTERDDTVQYYWGLSNYRQQDYVTADANFAKFVESYPRSPFTRDARFLRLDCLYRQTLRYELDPSPTYGALTAIAEYRQDYPDNDKEEECRAMIQDLQGRLDTKAYEGALLYFRMEDYKAAHVALKNILKSNSENMHREKILYYIAKSSYKYAQLSVAGKQKERYMNFVDDYYNFISEYPVSAYTKELSMLNVRAQRHLGKNVAGADVTGKEKELNDKKFERKAAKNRIPDAE